MYAVTSTLIMGLTDVRGKKTKANTAFVTGAGGGGGGGRHYVHQLSCAYADTLQLAEGNSGARAANSGLLSKATPPINLRLRCARLAGEVLGCTPPTSFVRQVRFKYMHEANSLSVLAL